MAADWRCVAVGGRPALGQGTDAVHAGREVLLRPPAKRKNRSGARRWRRQGASRAQEHMPLRILLIARSIVERIELRSGSRPVPTSTR